MEMHQVTMGTVSLVVGEYRSVNGEHILAKVSLVRFEDVKHSQLDRHVPRDVIDLWLSLETNTIEAKPYLPPPSLPGLFMDRTRDSSLRSD